MPRSRWETHIEPHLTEIAGMARNGVIDRDIAKALGVAYSTFRKYVDEKPELAAIVKQGKDYIDCQVEEALLKRALGYEYTEVTRELTGREMVVTKEVVKQVVPDTTAQIFWLKNRRPDDWRDKQTVEVPGLKEEQSKLSELLDQRKRRRDQE